jgi:hypothetical protein
MASEHSTAVSMAAPLPWLRPHGTCAVVAQLPLALARADSDEPPERLSLIDGVSESAGIAPSHVVKHVLISEMSSTASLR